MTGRMYEVVLYQFQKFTFMYWSNLEQPQKNGQVKQKIGASVKNAVHNHWRNQTNVNKPKFYSVYTREKK